MKRKPVANWVRKEDGLSLDIPRIGVVAACAADIVGVEFKGRTVVGGVMVACPPSTCLPGLRLRRFPAELFVCVTRPSREGKDGALAWLELRGRDGTTVLPGLPVRDDQVLVGDTWSPLVEGQSEEVGQLVKDLKGRSPWRLPLRTYLSLLTGNPGRLRVVSHTDLPAEVAPPDTAPGTGKDCGPLSGTLYPYQSAGVRWMCSLADEDLGCILGDQMGLGKTLQVIALVAREELAARGPTLVVAPATLLENWLREFAKFAPGVKVAKHRGAGRTGFPSELVSNRVVLTSYDTAVSDLALLRMIRWNLVVLDEAQAIKNPETARAKAVKELRRRVSLAVTGTPVENSLRDLWSILDFACPGVLGTLPEFEARYSDTTSDAADVEFLVTPLLLRREVAEVARDLPKRIDVPVPVELDSRGMAEYEAVRQGIIGEYGASATLVALTKLRMFCCHPFLLGEPGGDPAAFSTKYSRLLEILDEIASRTRKAILFTSYQGMADLISSDVRARMGLPCTNIDGRTPVGDRQDIVDRFQSARGPELLILNPRAAGTGLNITAASHVIHYNLEWNPAVEDQATARAYRLGQTLPVVVHRLFHPGTVEEIIDERLVFKRELASAAVVGRKGTGDQAGDVARAIAASPFVGKGG